jgi:hypothetical protein
MTTTRFVEVQRFPRVMLGVMVLFSLGLLGLMFHGACQQLLQGQPWGDRPLSDGALIGVIIGTTLLLGAVTLIIGGGTLTTEVRDDGLYLRYFPFHRSFRRFDPGQIAAITVETYSPLLDYGGWGLRYGRGGKAYTVRGRRGVRLALCDGKPLLIGSQRPEELAEALKSIHHAS